MTGRMRLAGGVTTVVALAVALVPIIDISIPAAVSAQTDDDAAERAAREIAAARERANDAAAQDFEKAYAAVGKASMQTLIAKKELQQVNKALLTSEQKLGNSDGLPRRDWFKHQIYAPGFYTGYGVKTMPQIREGLEEGRFTEAQGGVRTVAAAVNALAAHVKDAAGVLQQAVK